MEQIRIYKDFKSGVPCLEIYEKYNLSEKNLLDILQKKIKGNYDYKRILSGGIKAQKQFINHLNNRWNPLDPEAAWEEISPYVAEKTPEE